MPGKGQPISMDGILTQQPLSPSMPYGGGPSGPAVPRQSSLLEGLKRPASYQKPLPKKGGGPVGIDGIARRK